MHRSTGLAASAALATLAMTAAGIQTATAAQGPSDRPDRVSSTRPMPTSGPEAESAVDAAAAHPGTTKVDDERELVVTHALKDSTGATHVRMRRTYRDLRVIGGDLVVHRSAAGTFKGTTQTLDDELTLSTTARISAKKARKAAGARKKTSRKPELVVDARESTPHLAWLVTTTGRQDDGTPSRVDRYVDARTGTVLRSEQRIQTVDGDGDSLYGGNVPLQLTASGGSFQLKDPTRGGTYTIDVDNQTDSFLCQLFGYGCATGPVYTSPDTHFGTGSNNSSESAAVDAQYGTNVTWDYYQDTFGRNGIFGTGAGSYNRVHYGQNYVNAFWDGEKMTYGDGDGSSYGPLTSLDVTGHEMSHGVTENTAGLTYSGESGGLNEATSDIFGSMVEFSANNPDDPGDYLIGEEFDLAGHRGLRRMDDPASDGSSLGCYASNAGNVDVHYSSGIGNHFYYLLAEGSGPKTIGGVAHDSPTCDGSSVSGIGRTDAQQIWYRALTVYMTSGTNYAGARTATLNAARDLFGAGSAQASAVASAWSAVDVG